MDSDFNPRTPCGVRLKSEVNSPLVGSNFNPRTPCGVRHPPTLVAIRDNKISIHAPLAGCDHVPYLCECTPKNFNPRTPCGVRLEYLSDVLGLNLFQSTHPLRGATYDCCTCKRAVYISIHAPLAGCDNIRLNRRSSYLYFNPRTPCGVRLGGQSPPSRVLPISIHAPLAGCDTRTGGQGDGGAISIHAPLAGCDSRTRTADQSVMSRGNFNPRTPCGVRLYILCFIQSRNTDKGRTILKK